MKRHDSSSGSNVRQLEKHMSLWNRLFNLLAVRRGALRLKKLLKLALLLVPVFALLWIGTCYLLEKAYGLSVEQIHFKSSDNIIDKQQVLRILELGDSVNMATRNRCAKNWKQTTPFAPPLSEQNYLILFTLRLMNASPSFMLHGRMAHAPATILASSWIRKGCSFQ